MIDLEHLKEKLQAKRTERDLISKQLNNLKYQNKTLKTQVIRKERALEFIKDIALKTQAQLEYHLSDMVSTGLNTVFDTEYNFKVLFEIKRGKTECGLWYEKDGNLVDPISMSGLGAADIAAFCLRCAGWSMTRQYRNTLVLDEPMTHLSLNHHERAGELIKMLSKELGLQIIMVTHSERFTNFADKIFEVKMKKRASKVKVLN